MPKHGLTPKEWEQMSTAMHLSDVFTQLARVCDNNYQADTAQIFERLARYVESGRDLPTDRRALEYIIMRE